MLDHIGQQYGLFLQQEAINVNHEHQDEYDHEINEDNYFIQHTSPSFLIDSKGYLQLVYFYGTDVNVMTAGIRNILQLNAQ